MHADPAHPHDHTHAHDHGHDHAHAHVGEITALDPNTFGPDQLCFGCGPNNPHGLRLRFEREGDIVRTRLTLGPGFDGPPGILHGGLQAMIADEVAGWVLVGLRGRMGLTTSMQVRYIRSLRLGEEIIAEGRLVSEGPGTTTMRVTLRQGDRVGCMAKVSFAMANVAKLEEVLQGPLPPGWAPFFGG